jgi:hypothetical protein
MDLDGLSEDAGIFYRFPKEDKLRVLVVGSERVLVNHKHISAATAQRRYEVREPRLDFLL